MEIISTVEDDQEWHIENAKKQALLIQPDLLVVWHGRSNEIAQAMEDYVRRGEKVYQFYYYRNPTWPVDPLVWISQQKETADHHRLAGGRWITNVFSNFFPFREPIVHKGLSFETPENYYQAMKSRDPEYQALCSTLSPGKAKRLSKKTGTVYSKRANWYKINIKVMFTAQRHRIQTDPMFKEWLIDTEGQPIIEWNNWGDEFWGCDIGTGDGLNWLGRILMMIRDYRLYEPWENE